MVGLSIVVWIELKIGWGIDMKRNNILIDLQIDLIIFKYFLSFNNLFNQIIQINWTDESMELIS